MSRDYHRVWFLILALALAVEGVAIFRPRAGDTLSEYTWAKTHGAPLRVTLGALLCWLVYHWLFSGPGRGFSRWDALFAAIGAFVGLLSYFWVHR